MTQELVTDYQHIIDTVTLIMGSKGVFDVKVDEETIFSKKALGRHAQPGEVLQLFKELVGPDVPTYPRSE